MSTESFKSECVVLVARHHKAPFGFRWEVRRFGIGASLERSTRSYPTETAARAAGDAARAVIEGLQKAG
ncbi:hypothetical protein [Lichenihabitans psoromatis]|uniref:hypothetical protein n=1 Tax=Lichenihabitans psoromatis TaxID=2528642 RepID=UPI0010364786|nr:hypothetical protein [Lichenihabitans psoromatis]